MNSKCLIKDKHLTKSTLIIEIASFISFATVLLRSEFLSSFMLFLSFSSLTFLIVKYSSFKVPKKENLLLFIPFVLTITGLIFTNSFFKGAEFVLRSTPLLFVPLTYLNLKPNLVLKAYDFIFKYFPVLTVVIFALYALIGAIYVFEGYGNYLYYSNFALISDIHSTYFGLIINLSLWFVIKRKHFYSKIVYYGFFLSFFVFQLIVASKVSLFVCVLLIMFDVLLSIKNNYYKLIVSILITGGSILLAKQFIENRFLSEKKEEHTNLTGKEILSNFFKNDISARVALWESNIEALNGAKWVYGNGTSSSDELRKDIYKKNSLKKAFEDNYNAHNQFIEVLFTSGIIGLIIFVVHCLAVLRLAVKTRGTKVNVVIYLGILLYFFTESVLQRTAGIVLYAFIITYIQIQYMPVKIYESD